MNVYCVHPGAVLTNLLNHMMPSIAIQALMPLTEPFMKTPWHGAQTILYCLLEDSLGMLYLYVLLLFYE